jgi:hypothetical protein
LAKSYENDYCDSQDITDRHIHNNDTSREFKRNQIQGHRAHFNTVENEDNSHHFDESLLENASKYN